MCVFFINPQKWPCQCTSEILMEARTVLGLFWSLGKFQVLEAVVYWTSTPLSFCDSEGNVRKQVNKKLGPQFCPQENMQEAKQMSFIIPEKKDGVPNRRAQSPTEGGQKCWLPRSLWLNSHHSLTEKSSKNASLVLPYHTTLSWLNKETSWRAQMAVPNCKGN